MKRKKNIFTIIRRSISGKRGTIWLLTAAADLSWIVVSASVLSGFGSALYEKYFK